MWGILLRLALKSMTVVLELQQGRQWGRLQKRDKGKSLYTVLEIQMSVK